MHNQLDTRSTTADMNDLMNLNQGILQAEEDGLQDNLALHLHKDFTIVRASGVKQNRQTYLDAIHANAHRGRTSDPPEVRLYGECAVVICRVSTAYQPDGMPAVGHFWNTRVFVRQDGEWYCVAWQVTEASGV